MVDITSAGMLHALLSNKSTYGAVPQTSLLTRFQSAVDLGGRFVPHLWKWDGSSDWNLNSAVVKAVSYVKRCATDTGHIIGMTIGREPLPERLFSSSNFIFL